MELEIREFGSGKEFVLAVEDILKLDLLILEEYLEDMPGSDVARCFRSYFRDTILVFCTGSDGPTFAAFESMPFRYLDKNSSQIELTKSLQEILQQVKNVQKEPYIICHYRSVERKIKLKDIMYIKVAKRGAEVITYPGICAETDREGKWLISKKPSELKDEFSHHGFAMVQYSYLVNMYHVEEIRNDDILFSNGECMKISRAYKNSFKDGYRREFAAN